MKNNVFITKSFTETQKLGEDFIKKTNKKIIMLRGELGSGKTTFVQGVALGLGIKKRIISPTFIIIRSYEINNKAIKASYLYHIDLYRIDNSKDVLGIELEEIIKDPKNLVIIEWPEKIGKLLLKEKAVVNFEYVSGNIRKISIHE